MKEKRMDEIIEKMRENFTFKPDTEVGDIVTIYFEETSLLTFGVVQKITKDLEKKDEWWNVQILFLTVPTHEVVWQLRYPQFTGQEIFTMGDHGRFITAIETKAKEKVPSKELKDFKQTFKLINGGKQKE